MTCWQTCTRRLGERRVALARHDGRGQPVVRQHELAKAATWAGREETNVIGDLEQRDGDDVERPGRLDQRVVRAHALELVGVGNERAAGKGGDLLAERRIEAHSRC